jgi:3-phosphoshikimate 1-carboxyvinyltransferase
MGADIAVLDPREVGGEPVADLRVRGAALRGIEVPPALVPLAIDEFPALFVAAACAQGRTVVTGAEELRVKESDRIAAMADGLAAVGLPVQPTADGMIVEGRGGEALPFAGGTVESLGDHRIAMAMAIAALRSRAPIRVRDTGNVATSVPGFTALAAAAGLGIAQVDLA